MLGVAIEFSQVLESAVGKILAVVVGISWGSSASLDFSRCVLVGSSSNADVDFSLWSISAYPAVASDQLLVALRLIDKSYAEPVDSAIDIEEGLRSRRSCARPQGAQGGHPVVQGAQSSQSSQSAHQPQQQQLAQQSGHQRFGPHGHQFKKKSGSGSSGSGSSSSSGSRAEFCGFCGGKHSSTKCVGVQGSCNICGQYGHFTRLCPSAGSQQAAAPPQGRGGSSRGCSPQFPQSRVGETQFRPFQLPGPSCFG
ncbi:hypothetical protein F511_39786 [Dorcoceras hygrometricum]|uniref:CCHC-type domain-containing protein n=1 Tax=Dorcoceras hygrometricum TaxID=472368 RepID=A0A2Z7AY78_9LAMI|nr:hypothetical protein F511_39786 [Dorcoceras hygrometricum]